MLVAMKAENLKDLSRIVVEDAKNNKDTVVSVRSLQFKNSLLHSEAGPLEVTSACRDQLASKLGMPPTVARYLQETDHEGYNRAMQLALHKFQQENENKEVLLRSRTVGGVEYARAVLSTRYGIMDNWEALKVLQEAFPTEFLNLPFNGIKNGPLIDPYSGRMQTKILVPAIVPGSESDEHSFGFIIKNDETGRGCLEVSGSYVRKTCTNQLQGLSKLASYSHRGYNRFASIEKDFLDLVQTMMQSSGRNFQKYWDTRDKKLDNAEEFLLDKSRLLGLSKKATMKLLAEGRLARNVESTGSNVYSVVQSLTEFARDLEDAEMAEMFETAAGALVLKS